MECEYCSHVLKTQGALKKHQNTAKYCLAKQNKQASLEHACPACNKRFTRKSSLDDHLKICKSNIPSVHELQELLEEKSREIFLIKKELDLSIQTIEELRKENSEYRKEMFILASKSVTNNITNIGNTKTTNNTQNLIISDWRPEVIQEKVEENFKLEHVEDGLKGVARFTSTYITPVSDGGVKRYQCTDSSREVFMYKDSDGIIQKDIGARKLKNAIKEPIIKKSTKLVAEERCRLSNIIAKTKDYDIATSSSINITNLTSKFQEIKDITENALFSKEMAVICT
jgi:hypothetical protein